MSRGTSPPPAPSAAGGQLDRQLEALARCAAEGWAGQRAEAFRALERLCALQVAAYGRRRGLQQRDELVDLTVVTEIAVREEFAPAGTAPTASQLLRACDRAANRLTQRRVRELRRFQQAQPGRAAAHAWAPGRHGDDGAAADEQRELSSHARLVATWVEQAAWTCAARHAAARRLPAFVLGVAGHEARPSARVLRHVRRELEALLARQARAAGATRAALALALRAHIAPRGRGRREFAQLLERCRELLAPAHRLDRSGP